MRPGIRNVVNRLLGIAFFAALFTVGVAAAVEAAAALAGYGSQLDPPIPYRRWWSDLAAVDLARTRVMVIAGSLIVLGLALLIFELWPRRRDRRTTVAEVDSGKADLRLRSVAPYLEDRLRALDWVRRADVRVKTRKGSAAVDARPLASRLTAADDLERARGLLTSSVSEVGLDPKKITVTPRVDKKTLRVQ